MDGRRTPTTSEWGTRERAALRSAVANRQWPQVRPHAAGLAESAACQLCDRSGAWHLDPPAGDGGWPGGVLGAGSPPTTAPAVPTGTLLHRVWECESTKSFRQRLVSPVLLQAFQHARALGQAEMAVWTRGLMPAPHALVPRAREHETFSWVLRPEEDSATGTIYTDGSMVDGPPYLDGLRRRLGWVLCGSGPARGDHGVGSRCSADLGRHCIWCRALGSLDGRAVRGSWIVVQD